ncbi:MAG TPA: hypothetical protein P5022_08610, partial [Candidatus Paceibacterota bacterium]|nr:hypothetical protein [Candidatus Paceibacterota bacterium]
MKCPECQCEFMYDRERGEISVIEERGPSETDSRESGHPNEWGHLLRRLGRLARREGRLEDAERLTRQAIDRFEAAGDERSVCGAKGDLALVLEARGDPAAALELHRDSGGMARKLGANVEITLEANPGTVEHGRFSEYAAAGVNRVSLGAQSFDDERLAVL